jgi:hypothetical protein
MEREILRVVVASPGDVTAERGAVERVFDEINHGIARDRNLYCEVWRWETDAYPMFHAEGPQGAVDEILPIDSSDLLIGIFWKRFGTPVKDAASGTEHEIRLAYAAWQAKHRPQIMLYFSQKPYSPRTQDELEQWKKVLAFREEFNKAGLLWSYLGPGRFERLLRQHVTRFLLNSDRNRLTQLAQRSSTENGEVDLVDISYSDSNSESLQPSSSLLDVKIYNGRSEGTFFSRAIFHVENIWELVTVSHYMAYVRSTHSYDVTLPLKTAPYTHEIMLSQFVKPNDVDRFLLRLGFDQKDDNYKSQNDYVAKFKIVFVYNKSGSILSRDIIFWHHLGLQQFGGGFFGPVLGGLLPPRDRPPYYHSFTFDLDKGKYSEEKKLEIVAFTKETVNNNTAFIKQLSEPGLILSDLAKERLSRLSEVTTTVNKSLEGGSFTRFLPRLERPR